MNRSNFERTIKAERKREQEAYEEFMPKGRKLNKTTRGNSAKRNWQEEEV
jgi:hypothetical protein